MSGETLLAAGYVTVLLLVVIGLDIYGRQSTGAWESRIFTGYHRSVHETPEPVRPDEWPHSEVHHFHRAVSLFVSVVAIVLATAEAIRHHAPAEIALLVAVSVPHGALLALLGRRLRQAKVSPPE
ncbi:hypothetical protein STRCI_007034 [Streptomyces cinnabarinus]|uniref:SdpI family protein n=1 Tax=Streptomyces cinnabarinus TaxID=67287 RepID=A0ABY7KLV1_9ACTN|nr:hypothetical protein [Streptomyces cinnabarinus]WAZ25530.1 hypothetical protein STRCI_007034 [Streptomyces cinnabarinus]